MNDNTNKSSSEHPYTWANFFSFKDCQAKLTSYKKEPNGVISSITAEGPCTEVRNSMIDLLHRVDGHKNDRRGELKITEEQSILGFWNKSKRVLFQDKDIRSGDAIATLDVITQKYTSDGSTGYTEQHKEADLYKKWYHQAEDHRKAEEEYYQEKDKFTRGSQI